MLSEAALDVADRLATPLMAFLRALGLLIAEPASPDPAHTLFARLSDLLLRLGRLTALGPIPVARLRDPPAEEPEPRPRLLPAGRTGALPHRPGWLLDTLPDLAPALAAELAPLLADPAIAELLAAGPGLQRALRPFLRGLGLTLAEPPAPSPPPPPPTRPHRPPAAPHPPPLNRAARRAAASRDKRQRRTPRSRTLKMLRIRNIAASGRRPG